MFGRLQNLVAVWRQFIDVLISTVVLCTTDNTIC